MCLPRTQKPRANTPQGLLQGHLFTLNIQQNNGKSCSRNGVVLKKRVLKRILKNQRVWSAGFSWKRGWVKNTSGLGLFRALLMMLGFLFSHQVWDTQNAEKNWWEHPARKKAGKKGRKKLFPSIFVFCLPTHTRHPWAAGHTNCSVSSQAGPGWNKKSHFLFQWKAGFSPAVRKISTSDLFRKKYSLSRFTLIFTQVGIWNFHRDPSVPGSRGEKFLNSFLGIPWDCRKSGFTSLGLTLCKTKLLSTKIPPFLPGMKASCKQQKHPLLEKNNFYSI